MTQPVLMAWVFWSGLTGWMSWPSEASCEAAKVGLVDFGLQRRAISQCEPRALDKYNELARERAIARWGAGPGARVGP